MSAGREEDSFSPRVCIDMFAHRPSFNYHKEDGRRKTVRVNHDNLIFVTEPRISRDGLYIAPSSGRDWEREERRQYIAHRT